MNVSLTPELERYVQEKVVSGRYHSASEVVREAPRLLEDHEKLRHAKFEALRTEIALGLDELKRGEAIELGRRGLGSLARTISSEGRARLSQPDRVNLTHGEPIA